MLTNIVGECGGSRMTGDCTIHSETQGPAGWSFTVDMHRDVGSPVTCTLKLSFADYNLWCASGSCAPADVARAVVEFMANHGAALPDSFDCSRARRLFADADEAIPLLIRG